MKLIINDDQAKIIIEALDTYSRAKCGQIKNALQYAILKDHVPTHEEQQIVENFVLTFYFPDLKYNESYGIRSQEVSDNARVAYDILQVIRHNLAWKKKPKGGFGVSFDKPLKTSSEIELPTIEEK